jgi:hypothetical protein
MWSNTQVRHITKAHGQVPKALLGLEHMVNH